MIHLERQNYYSQDGDSSFCSFQVHVIDSEDKLSQLIALEQQLELTEKKFHQLQDHVDYIRSLYQNSIQDPSTLQLCDLSSCNGFNSAGDSYLAVSSMHGCDEDSSKFDTAEGDLSKSSFNAKEMKKRKKKRPTGGPRKTKNKKSPQMLSPEDSSRTVKSSNQSLKTSRQTLVQPQTTSRLRPTNTVNSQARFQATPRPQHSVTDNIPVKPPVTPRLLRPHSICPQPPEVPDVIPTEGYLKSTIANDMKKIRPLQPDFNFRSIPFVAGKATSRSHNLGIKIQETLSIIKRNSPAAMCKVSEVNIPTPSHPPDDMPLSRRADRGDFTRGSRSQGSILRCKAEEVIATVSTSTLSCTTATQGLDEDLQVNQSLKQALLYIQQDFTRTLDELNYLKMDGGGEVCQHMVRIKELEEELDRKEVVVMAFSKLYHQVAKLKGFLGDSWSESRSRCGTAKTKSSVGSLAANMDGGYPPVVKLTRLLRRIQDLQNRMEGYPD